MSCGKDYGSNRLDCGKFNILSFSQGFKNGLDLYANHIQLTSVYDRKKAPWVFPDPFARRAQ